MVKEIPLIGDLIKYSKGTAVLVGFEKVPNRFGTSSILLELDNGDRISPQTCTVIHKEL